MKQLYEFSFHFGNESISMLTSPLNVFMQMNGTFHHICYYFSVEMFISSPPALLPGSSLLHTKQHRADCGPRMSRRTKSSRERKEGERERERKKGLVWFRNHLTTSPGN